MSIYRVTCPPNCACPDWFEVYRYQRIEERYLSEDTKKHCHRLFQWYNMLNEDMEKIQAQQPEEPENSWNTDFVIDGRIKDLVETMGMIEDAIIEYEERQR